MAFAVEPYIFDWIFFDDSSISKLGSFKLIRRTATKCPVRLYIPTTDWLGMCDIFPAWAFVLLIRVMGSQGLEFGISKCSACAFLWTYPEIRTCSIESWWHSSLRVKQRHTTRNWHCNGPNQSAKPTKSLSAAFTHHSKKRF